jgi:Mg2+ and Co2+ transporter CorA
MYESDAIDQLHRLLIDLDSIEKEVENLEHSRTQKNYNTRSEILALLTRLRPSLHTCNKVINHFSRPIPQEKDEALQMRMARLSTAENIAKRLDDIIHNQNEIVSAFTRDQLKLQICNMPRESVRAELEALRYQIDQGARTSVSTAEYMRLLESRLAYLDMNEP